MGGKGHTEIGAVGLPGDRGSHGKYRILAKLGEGGMATVHLALARGPSGFNKLVVLKELKRELAEDPEFRKMFMREAQLAARLNHPGVVQTYEVIEAAGAPVIVMEYLDGQTLAKVRHRAKGGLDLGSHLRIITNATGALHYAHELTDFDGRAMGLVHRDMTPHNIFVTFEGQVKLLDFGIAKLTTSSQDTQMGVIKGKLRYMPPEQIAGDSVDRRTDIYAVGVMLWEAATGQPMWKGDSDATVMKHVLCGEIPGPRAVQPQTPAELETICLKALSPAPDDRYATAAELEADLETLLEELGSRVNGRSIAKFTSLLFADARAETKALIEAHLGKVALRPTQEQQSPRRNNQESRSTVPPYGAVSGGDHAAPAGRVRRSAVVAVSGPRWAIGARHGVVLVMGVIGAALVVSIWLAVRSRSPSAADEGRASESPIGTTAHLPAVVAATAPAASAAPGPTTVEGGTTPVSPDRTPQRIVAASTAPTRGAGDEAPAHAAAAAPGPSKPVVRTDKCHPPFDVDSSGIKRFKLECL